MKPKDAEKYLRDNPLGGPAKVFEACADAIRSGDNVDFAMASFGLAWATNDLGNTNQLTHECLRKWSEAIDKEMPHGLGERLMCFADAWREQIERLRTDRDCEKRMRKNSDDLATDLRLKLEAALS